MKLRQLYLFLLFFLLLAYGRARASHIIGGDLRYEYVSGTQYKIILTIYGDCAGQIFPTLANATPTVAIKENGVAVDYVQLEKEEGTGKEVTPVCPKDSANTACKNPPGTLPGIAEYIYSNVVDITHQSDSWQFIFYGDMGGNSRAGRTGAIGNIIQPQDGSVMFMKAKLNNTLGPNSSPKYTTIPTPFFCINKQQEYNQGAIDPDGNVLSFLLTPAQEPYGTDSSTDVAYVSPYTPTAPLATATGAFNFNGVNGQMSFTPNLTQISVVDNTVEEYKNGVLVGTSMREMTFIVLNNCGNNPPVGKIDTGVVGGTAAPGNTINVCQGSPHISFSVNPIDSDGNSITVSTTGVPFGGILNVSNNNSTNPRIDFNWDPPISQPLGTYTFYINYKDDGCPLSSNQTIAYTINIVNPLNLTSEILYPTQCAHNAYIRFTVSGGAKPRIIDLVKGNLHTAAYSDSTSNDSLFVVEDSIKRGDYTINVFSPYLKCRAIYSLTVPDSGVYPYPPVYDDIDACLHDPVSPILLHIDTTVFRLNWYDADYNKITGPPVYNTDSVGTQTWHVSQTHLVCESEKVDFNVFVHPPPVAEVLTQPVKLCLGDEVLLSATGGVSYSWMPESKVYRGANNYVYTKVLYPTTYSVVAKSEYGCLDTADVTFDDIEQCCTFSYPNAFTPNGDGLNDGFRALLYGNASEYMLAVYNRWGQQVFQTSDPRQAWDGNFHGKPCEAGVYFYRLKAACVTGHLENRSGDFTLIR